VIREVARPVCLVCGGGATKLYSGLTDNLFSAPGSWTLVKCVNASCAILWLNPAPHPDDLQLLYSGYYTHGDGSGSPVLRAARAIYKGISSCLLAPLGILAEQSRARIMFIARTVPGTLLDVGCGDGRFLSLMASRGWRVAGVDFDPQAVAHAREVRRLDVQVGTAATPLGSGRRFDLVTASHVIEHVPEPADFLRQCRQLINPGGQIVLRTPNAESFGHLRYGSAWRGLEPPRHLQLFTLAALAACARQAGLRVVSGFTTIAEAEAILIVSHFLRRKGSCRLQDLSTQDLITWSLLAPWLAARARLAWWADRGSGEEIYVILEDAAGSVLGSHTQPTRSRAS
jgi:2-polyprenyl-3-methyl-5-hydroxy-6-metoxy-1,4-benzoquinol methylase